MAGKVTRSLRDRFVEKIKKTSSCWNWIANKNKKGYGRFWVNGRNEFAHRTAWNITFGEINGDLRVLHRCDNPSCVNPKHLFIGTHADNGSDKARKGRSAKGGKNGNSKLSVEDVLTIRNSHDSVSELSRAFHIDRTQIWNIIKRKQWRHV